MVGIGTWMRAKIAANATLTGLIGTRFYPTWIPQLVDTYPSVTYKATYTDADPNKTQRITAYNVTVEITIWGKHEQYDTIETVDFAMQNVFDFGESTTAGLEVVTAYHQSSADSEDERMEYLARVCTYQFRIKRT
jgi:hypothetical protein